MSSSRQMPQSDVQALVKQIRDIVNSPSQPTISLRQAKSVKRRAGRDSEWISQIKLPEPEGDVLSILLEAIKALGDGGEDFAIPDVAPVEAEWVGQKKDSGGNASNGLSEPEKYEMLVQDCSSRITILYVHGGGYFQGSPDECRSTTSTLARLTGGKCFSVAYRLAPQHPFPAAILDTFVAYLALLSPPTGCFHQPIPASTIVLAGDSAGAAICFAVIKIIIQAQRRSQTIIMVHGREVLLELPAGLAAFSAYGDLSHSMPSWLANIEKDYLPHINPTLLPTFPTCDIWPADPPRFNVFCNHTVFCHPLVSPVAMSDWSGFPPLWLCYGEEMMVDEGKFIAQRAADQGVKVTWEEYEIMPHCFALLPPFGRSPQTRQAFAKCAAFCKTCVGRPEQVRTNGTFNSADDMQETAVDMAGMLDLSLEEVKGRMRTATREMMNLMARLQHGKTKL